MSIIKIVQKCLWWLSNSSNAILQTRGSLCALLWVEQHLAPFPKETECGMTLHLVCVHDQEPPAQHQLWGRLKKSWFTQSIYSQVLIYQDKPGSHGHTGASKLYWRKQDDKLTKNTRMKDDTTWAHLDRIDVEAASIHLPIIRPGCGYVIGCTGYILTLYS